MRDKVLKIYVLFICLSFSFTLFLSFNQTSALSVNAQMPFYDLCPQNLVLRSKFYTSFSNSSDERKHNIKIACEYLDKSFVDVGGEFSFNNAVGVRNEQRGFLTSKIIVGGEFVDGIGGGVCQVSTTLYNAVLLSGLKITEYHPHSLAVSYVAPSFDAMVSYGFADFRFINDTHNPIIIRSTVINDTVNIEIYGEPCEYTYLRQSVTVGEIPAPKEKEILDEKNEYPDLYEGQRKVIKYSKAGLKSQGFLITLKNGKIIRTSKIRSDSYGATQGLVVLGNATTPITEEPEINLGILILKSFFRKIIKP